MPSSPVAYPGTDPVAITNAGSASAGVVVNDGVHGQVAIPLVVTGNNDVTADNVAAADQAQQDTLQHLLQREIDIWSGTDLSTAHGAVTMGGAWTFTPGGSTNMDAVDATSKGTGVAVRATASGAAGQAINAYANSSAPAVAIEQDGSGDTLALVGGRITRSNTADVPSGNGSYRGLRGVVGPSTSATIDATHQEVLVVPLLLAAVITYTLATPAVSCRVTISASGGYASGGQVVVTGASAAIYDPSPFPSGALTRAASKTYYFENVVSNTWILESSTI